MGARARAIDHVLEKLFNSRSRPTGGGNFSFTTEGFVYLLIAGVLVIIGVLVWLLWRGPTIFGDAMASWIAMAFWLNPAIILDNSVLGYLNKVKNAA